MKEKCAAKVYYEAIFQGKNNIHQILSVKGVIEIFILPIDKNLAHDLIVANHPELINFNLVRTVLNYREEITYNPEEKIG